MTALEVSCPFCGELMVSELDLVKGDTDLEEILSMISGGKGGSYVYKSRPVICKKCNAAVSTSLSVIGTQE